jgi:adenylosuccinate lyase
LIERYTLAEMERIWSAGNKFQKWLDIELAAVDAMAELGLVPASAACTIREKACFDVGRIGEIEAVVDHDVIAFLTCVGENVGPESRFIHLGLTSSDIVDTALSLLMREAGEQIEKRLIRLREVLITRAREHRHTLMIGRTHGVHAEPVTFGLKMLFWVAEVDRDLERVRRAVENISVGKLSGPVGTYSSVDPRVEEYVTARLGLKAAPVSTQVLSRDRHAEYMTTMALVAGSCEKFATEIRSLQRTELLEAEEYFKPGQKGSSAMPHKRNPITAERVAGLARIVRGNACTAMEDMALWHERDITHSSVERVIIPDSTTLVDYMLDRLTGIMANLLVYPERMRKNMELTRGLIFSPRVLLALRERGLTTEEAYDLVQANAMTCWRGGREFKDLLREDPGVTAVLSAAELDELFDYNYPVRRVDEIFRRFGL